MHVLSSVRAAISSSPLINNSPATDLIPTGIPRDRPGPGASRCGRICNPLQAQGYQWVTRGRRDRRGETPGPGPANGSPFPWVPYFGVHWNAISGFSSKPGAAARLGTLCGSLEDLGPISTGSPRAPKRFHQDPIVPLRSHIRIPHVVTWIHMAGTQHN